jgi:hypothetical protein
MKIASDLPVPVAMVKDTPEVKALTGIKPVRPVKARTRPPPVVQPHEHDATGEEERHHDPHVDGGRRGAIDVKV